MKSASIPADLAWRFLMWSAFHGSDPQRHRRKPTRDVAEVSEIHAQLILNATEHRQPAPTQAKECCWIFKAVMQSFCRVEDAHLGAFDLDAHAVSVYHRY